MSITDKAGSSHANACNVEQSSTSPPRPPLSQDISKIITTVLSEEKEKEKHRLNHNFKESQESDPQRGRRLISMKVQNYSKII